MRERLRLYLPIAAALAILVPLGWMWQQSLLPGSYSAMDMGHEDLGGGMSMAAMHHAVSVTSLVADPTRPADVRVALAARQQRFHLASGEEVDGYTVNGTSPGPTIHAVEGQLVEVVPHERGRT